MKRFVIYNKAGKILRVGTCQNMDFELQAHENEFIMEGEANDALQKIVDNKIVDKTPEEIEAEKPQEKPRVPEEKCLAHITDEQWQDVLKRLTELEAES